MLDFEFEFRVIGSLIWLLSDMLAVESEPSRSYSRKNTDNSLAVHLMFVSHLFAY